MQSEIKAAGLAAMECRMESYQSGAFSFPALVSELETTFNGITGISAEQRDQFFRIWETLEEVNALTLDAGDSEPRPEHNSTIAEAFLALQRWIENERT